MSLLLFKNIFSSQRPLLHVISYSFGKSCSRETAILLVYRSLSVPFRSNYMGWYSCLRILQFKYAFVTYKNTVPVLSQSSATGLNYDLLISRKFVEQTRQRSLFTLLQTLKS